MIRDEETARAMLVQNKYTDELMNKSHVMGVAVGKATRGGLPTDNVCLVVLVDQKVPLDNLPPEDHIPSSLDGVCVDVQEIGQITAQ